MKDKKEILFNAYESVYLDERSIFILPDNAILDAMEEYANEKLTAFMIDYIGRGASKFEVQRMIKEFDEKYLNSMR